jgi:SulP family sulfate permease
MGSSLRHSSPALPSRNPPSAARHVIKYIPYAVTVGFTAGSAINIIASQIRDLLDLTLTGQEPGPILPNFAALAQALPTTNAAANRSRCCEHLRSSSHPPLPPTVAGLIAVAFASLRLDVRLAGRDHRHALRRLPYVLPAPSLPAFSMAKVGEVFPLSFAPLGGVAKAF